VDAKKKVDFLPDCRQTLKPPRGNRKKQQKRTNKTKGGVPGNRARRGQARGFATRETDIGKTCVEEGKKSIQSESTARGGGTSQAERDDKEGCQGWKERKIQEKSRKRKKLGARGRRKTDPKIEPKKKKKNYQWG